MNSFSRLARTFLVGSAAAIFCTAAFAQTTSAIQTLSHELTLPFERIGFAGTPSIPANVLAAITGGALEVRQSIERRPDGTYRVRHFLVARDAPNPTPADAQGITVIGDLIVRADNVVRWPSVSATPPGSNGALALVGTVVEELATSPFGSARNRPVIYSFGYEMPGADATTTRTTFTNTTFVIPGLITTYIPTGAGTLTLSGTTPGGGGEEPTGPVIGIADRITTLQPELELNAMATDAGGGALTYSWRVVRGSANILNPTSDRPRVQIPRVFGEHTLEVTVTNAAGQSTTKQFVIFYSGTGSF
jgi:hypothetical protein